MGIAQRSSKSSDWGTPDVVVDAVRECLGGVIGFDPCSSTAHQRRVRASRYCDGEFEDGLKVSWRGLRTFVNPPGSASGVQPWWQKFTAEVKCGIWLGFNMNQLAYLEPNPLAWSEWIFIPRKRLRFVGAGENPPHNSYLIGVGCSGRPLSVAMLGALQGLSG